MTKVVDGFIYDEEYASNLYRKMRKQCGCDHCENDGNNGCGCIYIDGWEFESGDQDHPAISYKDSRGNDLIACYKRLNRDEFEQLREQRENGTLMFRACIQAALDLMPKDCTPDVYGDIVRSAAAVCCHNSGTDD